MLFRVYSRYVPNLTRQDGSAMERLLASQMSQGPLIEMKDTSGMPAYVPLKDVPLQSVPKPRGIYGRSRTDRTNEQQTRVTEHDDASDQQTKAQPPPAPPHAAPPALPPLSWADIGRNWASQGTAQLHAS